MTKREILRRHPRLIAHMMCASLGYFSVSTATYALQCYIEDRSCACEWYSHMCMCRGHGMFDEAELVKIGAEVVAGAFRNRHSHTGYMAEIKHAKAQVAAELQREGCTSDMLAAWF